MSTHRKTTARIQHRQSHYFEFIAFAIFVGVALFAISSIETITITLATSLVMMYFVVNVGYLAWSRQLTPSKVTEAGLIAFVSQLAIINFII